RFLDKDGFIDK
nr:Chain C, Peptide from Cytochrome P450 family 1 subfamily B polypeptide 1 [Canis lupus familiaris]5F1N_F Chain F, Peptide from Cytochrome P450 family 1 subfamily B polypeptide 1 [Canis lupus familiaris]